MNVRGIITADIVKSTAIPSEQREHLADVIGNVIDELHQKYPLKAEIFRGDSFQVELIQPETSLTVAVLLRAGLKSKSLNGSDFLLDARVSLGVGEISFFSDKVTTSDGEAFRLSGRGLDEMGKKRLLVQTKWDIINEEFYVSSLFADELINSWTVAQSQVVFLSLLNNLSQKDIAKTLGKSPQSVSKLLEAAKEPIIRAYLARFSSLIKSFVP